MIPKKQEQEETLSTIISKYIDLVQKEFRNSSALEDLYKECETEINNYFEQKSLEELDDEMLALNKEDISYFTNIVFASKTFMNRCGKAQYSELCAYIRKKQNEDYDRYLKNKDNRTGSQRRLDIRNIKIAERFAIYIKYDLCSVWDVQGKNYNNIDICEVPIPEGYSETASSIFSKKKTRKK